MKRLAYKASRFSPGLLDGASVELSKHLSMHSALRADHMMGGKSHPLSLTGEVRFTGCGRLPKSILLATPRRANLRSAESNAVDMNNSHSRKSDFRPHLSQYRTGEG